MIKRIAVYSSLYVFASAQAYAAPDHHGAMDAVAHHGDHHEQAGGLPQLDPSTFVSQAFWLIIIFTLLYLFFTFKSLPVISQTIEGRNERISNDLDSAERLRKEVQSVQQSYEESLVGARREAADLFKKIEDEIKAKSDKHARDFSEISKEKIDRLEKSIDKGRQKALDEIGSVAAEVASEASEKIIGVRPDEKEAQKIIASLKKAA